jgi:hypothetical protein
MMVPSPTSVECRSTSRTEAHGTLTRAFSLVSSVVADRGECPAVASMLVASNDRPAYVPNDRTSADRGQRFGGES